MTADTVGGVWTYVLELAHALGDRAEIHLATMGSEVTPTQRIDAGLAGVHLWESTYRLEWMDEPWKDLAAAGRWLLDLEMRIQPRLIHLNNFVHGALPFRAPVVVVGHSCVCSWWESVQGRQAPKTWDNYRAAVSNGLRGAALVVAPSEAMLQSLHRLYGPLNDARVVHNGIDCGLFSPVQKQPFILSAGRLWDDAKNIRLLGKIAPRLPWPVYIAGDCRSPDGHEAAIQNVHPLGCLRREDLASWLARAAIYALPARYEPFGLSVLEAASSGCALVIGDIQSLREIWADAAFYVPPDDADALYEALMLLIHDAEERKTMAARAAWRAQNFSNNRMAEEYWEMYVQLTGHVCEFQRHASL